MNDSKVSSRQLVVLALFVFAVSWVLLMGIVDWLRGDVSAATPGISGRSSGAARTAASFPRDGTLNPKVTSVDRDKAHVTLTVNVADKEGKVQRDLTDKEFEIYENGILAKVLKFTPAGSTGVRVALAVDYGDSHWANRIGVDQRELMLAGTKSLVNALHEGTDHFGMYLNNSHALQNHYREAVTMGPIDQARRDLAVKRLDNLRVFYSGGGIFPTMGMALAKLSESRGRRVLIVLTTGWDDLSVAAQHAATKDEQAKKLAEEKKAIEDLIGNAKKFSIPMYMIYPVGTYKAQEDVMQRLATESDGEFYRAVAVGKLTDYLIGVTENLRNEYTLEYDSPNPREDGTPRKINVVIRSAAAGASTADGSYRMPGVLASESSSSSDTAATSGSSGRKSSSSIFGVFFPLACLLALLFSVPYLLWLRPRNKGEAEPTEAAAGGAAPVAAPVVASPAAPAAAAVPVAKPATPQKHVAALAARLARPEVKQPAKSNQNVAPDVKAPAKSHQNAPPVKVPARSHQNVVRPNGSSQGQKPQ